MPPYLRYVSIKTVVATLALAVPCFAQQTTTNENEPADTDRSSSLDVLSDQQWQQVDGAVERALTYLAKQQKNSGAFLSQPNGQPGITSLGVMAFLSAGHSPTTGEYAELLHDAVNFALDCQQSDGLLSAFPPPARVVRYNPGHTMFYNHGITGLMLGEVYGTTSAAQNRRIGKAVPRAISLLRKYQYDKRREGDHGGWRYAYNHSDVDSDMSCTVWQLMLLRSAKNAGFDVPEEMVDAAVEYVQRCYDPQREVFRYGLFGGEQYPSGGSVGGAIVSLAMASKHNTPEARAAGKWLLKQNVERYNSSMGPGGNYHYAVYYGSQATFQLGGHYWRDYYPRVVEALLANQLPNGSWPPDAGIAQLYGSTYSTALAVLALTPPFQLLPIYQR